jgi:hypothetical protein
VRFVAPISDFSRVPVGHTCGCVIEIPTTYASAQEFSEEFGEVLMSNVWCMEFI